MIPDKVKIAGIEYKVQEIPGMENEFNHLGQILYTRGTIKIERDLSDDRKQQVLIHEVLHGVFYEAGYEEQDEDLINRVSIVLHQVLKDNKFNFSKVDTN